MVIAGAFLNFINIFLWYYDVDNYFVSFLAGNGWLVWCFMLICVYALKFKPYYKLCLYYTFIIGNIDIFDYLFGIPLSADALFFTEIGISVLFAIMITYSVYRNRIQSIENVNDTVKNVTLLTLKIIPIIISLIIATRNFLFIYYLGGESPLYSFVAGTSVLTVIFMYSASIVFRFCTYHRVFILFLAIDCLLNIYDWYFILPESFILPIQYTLVLITVIMFIISYIHVKRNKKTAQATA